MKYTTGTKTIECYDTHVNDGVHLMVTDTNKPDTVVMTLTMGDGTAYVESRTMHEGKAEFDVSEYIKETMTYDWHRIVKNEQTDEKAPKALWAEEAAVTKRCYIQSIAFVFGSETASIIVPMTEMQLFPGYSTDKPDVVEHLFNPNFPHIAEFYTARDAIDLVLTLNHEDPCYYHYGADASDHAIAYQFLLNDYWDERNTAGAAGQVLKASINENGQRALYHIDTRTSGCFLRFLDSEGLIQQLLLDVESKSKSYTDGDAVRQYGGQRHYYEDHTAIQTNGGSGITSSREQSRVLHCSLSNMPKGLVHDINALMLSPFVYMQDGENKWQEVRVVCDELTDETKKSQISVKIDVYTISDEGK